MSEWISVKDDLPEEGLPVLVFSPTRKKKMVCEMEKYKNYWDDTEEICWWAITTRNSKNRFTWKVTHWQNLPEDPKEEE